MSEYLLWWCSKGPLRQIGAATLRSVYLKGICGYICDSPPLSVWSEWKCVTCEALWVTFVCEKLYTNKIHFRRLKNELKLLTSFFTDPSWLKRVFLTTHPPRPRTWRCPGSVWVCIEGCVCGRRGGGGALAACLQTA